jgi:hypothetical protein
LNIADASSLLALVERWRLGGKAYANRFRAPENGASSGLDTEIA